MLATVILFPAGLFLCTLLWIPVVQEKGSRLVWLLLLALAAVLSYMFRVPAVGFLAMLLVTDLYLLFFSAEYGKLLYYCVGQLAAFALILVPLLMIPVKTADGQSLLTLLPVLFFPVSCLLHLWRIRERKEYPWGLALGVCVFAGCFFYLGLRGYGILVQLLTLVFLYLLWYGYRKFSRSFLRTSSEFQNQVMAHHYEEVKAVYLNMRGWRHDYHNHIQSMKAYLSMGEYGNLGSYLGELEQDLKEVDDLVKSGNLMVDAILNSKLSLAKSRNIRVSCKAVVPEHMDISDIDICVMLGNLLDNALEACGKIEEEKRFIRIYSDTVNSQFYFSVMNSAEEEPGFQQRSYISQKRGDHGHGMKRVKLTVDKYQGYLNLKNEPGIFASELMIPLG